MSDIRFAQFAWGVAALGWCFSAIESRSLASAGFVAICLLTMFGLEFKIRRRASPPTLTEKS